MHYLLAAPVGSLGSRDTAHIKILNKYPTFNFMKLGN